MYTSTTEYFTEGAVCYYILRTYEDINDVIMNITFTNVQNAEVYFIYKLKGEENYKED